MNKTIILTIAMIFISFASGIYLYPQMPNLIASHWNIAGDVDSYMSKFWGLFLLPLSTALIFIILMIIPKIDPLKKNIESFRKYYDRFIMLLTAFMLYIHLLTIFWNLGYIFNMSQMMAPAMGVLFYYLGDLIRNSKRNWVFNEAVHGCMLLD